MHVNIRKISELHASNKEYICVSFKWYIKFLKNGGHFGNEHHTTKLDNAKVWRKIVDEEQDFIAEYEQLNRLNFFIKLYTRF